MKIRYNPSTNLFEDSSEDTVLPQVMWHITDKCHLNCKTCFAKKTNGFGGDISIDQARKNIKYLKQLGVQKIDISGGEPLLYEPLSLFVMELIENGFYVTITTRGIGLEENYEWLENHWHLFSRVIVSLDGGSDRVCDYYASFENTMKYAMGLCADLRRKGCNNLRINTVVNRIIMQTDNMKELSERISEIVPKEWCLIQPHPLNKKIEYDNFAVDRDMYLRFCSSVVKNWHDNKTQIIFRDNSLYSTYWTLQNENTIVHLSDGEEYDYVAILSSETIDCIKNYISQCAQKIPM